MEQILKSCLLYEGWNGITKYGWRLDLAHIGTSVVSGTRRGIATHTLEWETPGMIRSIDKEVVVITQLPDTEPQMRNSKIGRN